MTNNRKLKLLSWAYIAYFALTMYWQFHYTGPFRFLGEIQVAMFGRYWAILNFIILHLPTAIGFFVVQSKIASNKDNNESESAPNSILRNPIVQDLLPSAFIVAITMWIVSIVSGQAFSPDLGLVDLHSIETGKISQSSYYAQVSGYSNGESVETQKGNDAPWIYIALHPEPNSQAPVHLIIASDKSEVARYIKTDPRTKKLTTTGYVENSARGEVRAWMEKNGVKIADNVKYITPRIDRDSAKNLPLGMGIAGIASAVYVFVQNRRER